MEAFRPFQRHSVRCFQLDFVLKAFEAFSWKYSVRIQLENSVRSP